jgi:hypothetical protein
MKYTIQSIKVPDVVAGWLCENKTWFKEMFCRVQKQQYIRNAKKYYTLIDRCSNGEVFIAI